MKTGLTVSVLIIATALAGCSPSAPPVPSPTVAPIVSPQPEKKLEVLQIMWGTSDAQQLIAGQVRNAGNEPLQNIAVELYALDGSNQLIWSTKLDVVPDTPDSVTLGPGDTASFGTLANIDLPDMKLYQYRFVTASGEMLQVVPKPVPSPSY